MSSSGSEVSDVITGGPHLATVEDEELPVAVLCSPPVRPQNGCGGDMAVFQLESFEYMRRGGLPTTESIKSELFCPPHADTIDLWLAARYSESERPQFDRARAAAKGMLMNLAGFVQIRHLTPGNWQQVQPITPGMVICAPYGFGKWSPTKVNYRASSFGFFSVVNVDGLPGSTKNMRMIPIFWNSKMDPDKSFMKDRFYNPNDKAHRNFCRILTPPEILCARASWLKALCWNHVDLNFDEHSVPLYAPFWDWFTEDPQCVVHDAWCTSERWLYTPKVGSTDEMGEYAEGRKEARTDSGLSRGGRRPTL